MRLVLRISLLPFLLCLILTGCSKPEIRAVTENSSIVAFGDSLTAGYGVSEEDSYPAVLSELISCEVINEGVSGEDTSAGLARLASTLEVHQPDLVVLCFGGNDMLRKQPEVQTISNLKAMIEQIQSSSADIVLIGVPKPGLLLSVPDFYQELAEQYALPFDDSLLPHILSKNTLKSDQIHPNEAGYRLMAERIHQLINDSER